MRSSALVGILHVLTFGLSSVVWLWVATREVDAHAGGNTRRFVPAVAVLTPLSFAVFFLLSNDLVPGAPSSGPRTVATMLLAGLLGTAGLALALAALWRLWGQLERSQRRAGVDATNRTSLFLLTLLPSLAMLTVGPFLIFSLFSLVLLVLALGVVGFWVFFAATLLVTILPIILAGVALGRTQAGLNRLWRAHPTDL